MIRKKPPASQSTSPTQPINYSINYLRTPSPEIDSWARFPRASSSDGDADDEDTTSMEDVRQSPPLTFGMEEDQPPTHQPYRAQRPTLPDVLSNAAPPPWTLSAFTAYLSQNHCLENLEFTLDAERYKEKHDLVVSHMVGMPISPEMEECVSLRMLWQRLLDAYIVPDGPREINIPSHVRERLLATPNHTAPPDPSTLDEAVRIIYNLMEESVLVSFLNDVPRRQSPTNYPQQQQEQRDRSRHSDDRARRKRGASDSSQEKPSSLRSYSRRRGSPTNSLDTSNTPFSTSDPTGRLTPANRLINSRGSGNHHQGSPIEAESMLDDSATTANSPGGEPMTPPNTPPSSDFGGSSPKNGRGQDHTWKKMLGWKKRSQFD